MPHNHDHTAKNLKTAFFLNLGFSLIELVGGILTNSLAIVSDAIHDFGDSFVLALSWFAERISKRGKDSKFTFGYRRVSLVGALINAGVLLIGAVMVLREAIPRLWEPQQPDPVGMLALALLGILVNGLAVLRLRHEESLNSRMVFLHLMEDILGWTAIFVVSILMLFFDVPILDPILSILISIIILIAIYRILRQTMRIVLQGVPKNIDLDDVRKKITAIDGIETIHDLHLWTLDGEFNILTAHVVLEIDAKTSELLPLKTQIRSTLQNLGIQHVTMEFETFDEACDHLNC